MKIVIVGSYKYEMYAPAFSSGFKQLGHDVIDIDYEQFLMKNKCLFSSLHNRLQDRYHFGLMMRKYNKAIIDAVLVNNPDFVFFYRCYHVWPRTMRMIKNKSLLISYNNDDPFSGRPSDFYYRFHLNCASCCDVNFVYRKKNLIDYSKIGITNTRLLLPYYLSWQNKPIRCDKDIPIAFIGHFENDGRDYTIKKMIEAGIPIRVYGREYRWEESAIYNEIKDVLYAGVRGEKYNELLNRCKIVLVFLSQMNHDTYTRRCFEIPATSSMMMAPYTDELNDLFKEGEEAVYYRNDEELIKKCKFYLENEDNINIIASNGFKRLIRLGGNEMDRCSEIIDAVKRCVR
jgi:hypothetical protein